MDRNELAKRLEDQADSILADSFGAKQNIRDLREAATALRQSAWRPMSEAPRGKVGATKADLAAGRVRVTLAPGYPAPKMGETVLLIPLPPPPSEGVEG